MRVDSDMAPSASVGGMREREPNSSQGAKANQSGLFVVRRVSSAPDEPSSLPPSLPSANYLLPLITEIRQRLRHHRQRRVTKAWCTGSWLKLDLVK